MPTVKYASQLRAENRFLISLHHSRTVSTSAPFEPGIPKPSKLNLEYFTLPNSARILTSSQERNFNALI
jgi:hypothetical protein